MEPAIDLINKSQNALAPYPTMLHPEQKYAHFVLNGASWDMQQVFWDLWNCSIARIG